MSETATKSSESPLKNQTLKVVETGTAGILGKLKAQKAERAPEKLSVTDWMELCKTDPSAYENFADRLLKAIGKPEIVDTRHADLQTRQVYGGRKIARYAPFKDLYDAETSDAESEDDFIWINEADLLDILFEGRSLPDMSKLKAESVTVLDRERAGHTNKGPEHKMDLGLTDRKRKEESLVLEKGAERRVLINLAEQFNILARHDEALKTIDLESKSKSERSETIFAAARPVLDDAENDGTEKEPAKVLLSAVDYLKIRHGLQLAPQEEQRLKILEERLKEQFKTRSKIGNFQDRHLTYNYDDDVPRPNAKAVMFCQMDVSGSMTQERKNTAKVFFWLLNKFLKDAYQEVDVVFISHTTVAREVDEQTFFYGTQSGGTLVSSCFEKTAEIIQERYDLDEWNIYSAQASDGDSSATDNVRVLTLLGQLMPQIQGHYYVEISDEGDEDEKSDLLEAYEKFSKEHNGKLHTAGNIRNPPDALRAFNLFFPVGGHSLTRSQPQYAPAW